MKKAIYILTAFCALFFLAPPAFSLFYLNYSTIYGFNDEGKKKEIKIVSNRASGEMVLRYQAAKAEKVTIKVLNEAGEMVLKQLNDVAAEINNIPLKDGMGLAEGKYTVHLISSKETYSTAFIIWK